MSTRTSSCISKGSGINRPQPPLQQLSNKPSSRKPRNKASNKPTSRKPNRTLTTTTTASRKGSTAWLRKARRLAPCQRQSSTLARAYTSCGFICCIPAQLMISILRGSGYKASSPRSRQLSSIWRRYICQLFKSGLLVILAATSTLATGRHRQLSLLTGISRAS